MCKSVYRWSIKHVCRLDSTIKKVYGNGNCAFKINIFWKRMYRKRLYWCWYNRGVVDCPCKYLSSAWMCMHTAKEATTNFSQEVAHGATWHCKLIARSCLTFEPKIWCCWKIACRTLWHPLFGTYCLQMRLNESPSTCFGMKYHTHLLNCQK